MLPRLAPVASVFADEPHEVTHPSLRTGVCVSLCERLCSSWSNTLIPGLILFCFVATSTSTQDAPRGGGLANAMLSSAVITHRLQSYSSIRSCGVRPQHGKRQTAAAVLVLPPTRGRGIGRRRSRECVLLSFEFWAWPPSSRLARKRFGGFGYTPSSLLFNSHAGGSRRRRFGGVALSRRWCDARENADGGGSGVGDDDGNTSAS